MKRQGWNDSTINPKYAAVRRVRKHVMSKPAKTTSVEHTVFPDLWDAGGLKEVLGLGNPCVDCFKVFSLGGLIDCC